MDELLKYLCFSFIVKTKTVFVYVIVFHHTHMPQVCSLINKFLQKLGSWFSTSGCMVGYICMYIYSVFSEDIRIDKKIFATFLLQETQTVIFPYFPLFHPSCSIPEKSPVRQFNYKVYILTYLSR